MVEIRSYPENERTIKTGYRVTAGCQGAHAEGESWQKEPRRTLASTVNK